MILPILARVFRNALRAVPQYFFKAIGGTVAVVGSEAAANQLVSYVNSSLQLFPAQVFQMFLYAGGGYVVAAYILIIKLKIGTRIVKGLEITNDRLSVMADRE